MDVGVAERDVPAEQGGLRQQQRHKRGLADARLATDADKAALGQFDGQRLPIRVVAELPQTWTTQCGQRRFVVVIEVVRWTVWRTRVSLAWRYHTLTGTRVQPSA